LQDSPKLHTPAAQTAAHALDLQAAAAAALLPTTAHSHVAITCTWNGWEADIHMHIQVVSPGEVHHHLQQDI
jgi:hypothetical protein